MKTLYKLPKLPYEYDALEPYISEKVLRIHHDKHHQGYVNNSNNILAELKKSRKANVGFDIKSMLKSLSFNVGGALLHTIFWNSMAPKSTGGGDEPKGKILTMINDNFISYEQFKKEFSEAAKSVEGSGWAVLTHDPATNKLLIMQVEKHNLNMYPGVKLLLALDVWEHAYYLDYKNERGKFVDGFWKVVNWNYVNKQL